MSIYSSNTGRWADYVDEQFAELSADLTLYGEEVTEKVKKACRKVATEMRDEIKQTCPKDTGEYQKGWRYREVFENANEIRCEVRNKTRPQLTYLLEYGHAIVVNGSVVRFGRARTEKIKKGRVEGRPHIRPAELKARKKLVTLIKEAVKE